MRIVKIIVVILTLLSMACSLTIKMGPAYKPTAVVHGEIPEGLELKHYEFIPASYDLLTCFGIFDAYVYDYEDSPEFRAGTVQIMWGDGFGSGFLFEKEDELFLGTVEHIAENSVSECLYAYVPGINSLLILNPLQFSVYQTSPDEDGFAVYALEQGVQDIIREGQISGAVSPLILSNDIPSVESIIASPRFDTGRYTTYEIIEITGSTVEIGSIGRQRSAALGGIICQGRSGGSVLKIDSNGNPTNLVIGVIKEGDTLINGHCGYELSLFRVR